MACADMSAATRCTDPVATWKQQAGNQASRKRKRITQELDGRDPKMLCTYEEGLARLPLELIYIIFSYLDVWSVVAVAGVCRSWRQLALDPYMWRRVEISARKCSSLQRVFKLALTGGHLEQLTLRRPTEHTVYRGRQGNLPLSAAALGTWFKASCVNLKSLRIENYNFSAGDLPACGIFEALPLNTIESLFIRCPNHASRKLILNQFQQVSAAQPHLGLSPLPSVSLDVEIRRERSSSSSTGRL